MSEQSSVITRWEVPLPQTAERQRALRRRADPVLAAAAATAEVS